MDTLIKKYNEMIKVIDEIFGKVPAHNKGDAENVTITLAEYFTELHLQIRIKYWYF